MLASLEGPNPGAGCFPCPWLVYLGYYMLIFFYLLSNCLLLPFLLAKIQYGKGYHLLYFIQNRKDNLLLSHFSCKLRTILIFALYIFVLTLPIVDLLLFGDFFF